MDLTYRKGPYNQRFRWTEAFVARGLDGHLQNRGLDGRFQTCDPREALCELREIFVRRGAAGGCVFAH